MTSYSKEMINTFIKVIYDFNKLSEDIEYSNKLDVNYPETRGLTTVKQTKCFGGSFDATVNVDNGKLVLNEDSLELRNETDDSCIGIYSLKDIFSVVATQGLDVFLKSLQEDEYNWPNVYFAWEKPNSDIYMIGIRSGLMGHIIEHEETAENGSKSYLTWISKYVSHQDRNGEYDIVNKICEAVKGYKYIGGWNDAERMTRNNIYNLVHTHGRWDEAKKHIFHKDESITLDKKISNIKEKASNAPPEAQKHRNKEDFQL